MNNSAPQHQTPQEQRAGVRAFHRVTAVLVGLGSAYAAAAATIRNEFWNDVKNTPDVKAKMDKARDDLKQIWNEGLTDNRATYYTKLIDRKMENHREMQDLMESHHFRTKGWFGLRGHTLGILDRSKSMSHNSRRDVMVNAVITAAIATGGTLMFFSNRHMRQQIDALVDTKQPFVATANNDSLAEKQASRTTSSTELGR